MKALLVVAHGSRRAASNEEVRALTQRVAGQASDHYQQVACAFLELADPSIPEGLRALIQSGATDITVLPYFLSAGRHVAEDIPAEVQKVQQQRPDIPIQIAPYVGKSTRMASLLLAQAGASHQD
jgi:sirohydrochlorin ferrochelatase